MHHSKHKPYQAHLRIPAALLYSELALVPTFIARGALKGEETGFFSDLGMYIGSLFFLTSHETRAKYNIVSDLEGKVGELADSLGTNVSFLVDAFDIAAPVAIGEILHRLMIKPIPVVRSLPGYVSRVLSFGLALGTRYGLEATMRDPSDLASYAMNGLNIMAASLGMTALASGACRFLYNLKKRRKRKRW